MIEPTSPRPSGRPSLPPEKKLHQRTFSFTLAQIAKIQRNGHDWLRALVDAAPERKKPGVKK